MSGGKDPVSPAVNPADPKPQDNRSAPAGDSEPQLKRRQTSVERLSAARYLVLVRNEAAEKKIVIRQKQTTGEKTGLMPRENPQASRMK